MSEASKWASRASRGSTFQARIMASAKALWQRGI